ncbi:LysR family transcriptional regulator [Hirschia baltica]|uniref:Transcriptional regulator, LysR family n=1 Tax=Hirschia baltica (strain ATCC 49814 / DSM 5838 / IFAM 1418) TaxID=582402 RepID=C6XPM2_HIRBI|nr:LysR family transcriptional regulator [Hirschia baltica]ACT60287.1 transcriptional regulator, LysR family [Hirschia baltica ATCC 49814]
MTTESISFRQLKLLETVGRVNSVRRASEECNLSQPAVTQAILKLESQLGVQLLIRSTSGSYLTELGRIFHHRAERFFDRLRDALQELPNSETALNLDIAANRISRSQINCLIAIFAAGNLEAAANELGLVPTSVQRALRTLEANVKNTLLNRTAAGLSLTPTGMNFGKRMKLALQEIEAAQNDIEISRGNTRSRITVGAMPFGGSFLLATVLDTFVQEFPNAEIKIVSENAPELMQSLSDGDVDFVVGLVQQDGRENLEYIPLADTCFHIVGRTNHPLSFKDNITTEDLLEYEWVVGTRGASRRECFEKLFEGTSGPHAPIRTSAFTIIRSLLESGDRLTLMTDYELMHQRDYLQALHYPAITPVPAIGITTRKDWLPTRLQKHLVDEISAHTKNSAYVISTLSTEPISNGRHQRKA